MKHHNIITAIDIGTNSVKTLIARKEEKEGKMEILGKGRASNLGLRKGEIAHLEETTSAIMESLKMAEEEAGIKVKSCICNINGPHLSSILSQGLVSVSRADQKISPEDVERVLHQAENITLPPNQEILESLAIDFTVDGEKGIKEPQGLKGTRLEVQTLLLCVFSPVLEKLTKAVLDANLQIDNIIPSALAAASSCLTRRERELGVVLLDIGAETSGMAVFEEGNLVDYEVFPIGSANITNDIALGLRTDIITAEKIKREYARLPNKISKKTRRAKGNKKEKTDKDKIHIPDKYLNFSRKLLRDIVEARISDIFTEVQKALKKKLPQKLLPGGIVLTGGGANLPGLEDYARQKLKLPARIGVPRGFENLEKNPLFSVVAGLLLDKSAFGNIELPEEKGPSFLKKLGGIFKIFLPS